MFSVDEAKSGIFTQYISCDSASFTGIPLIVTFVLDGSVPLTRIPVYPIPVPASEVVTAEGVVSNKVGKS